MSQGCGKILHGFLHDVGAVSSQECTVHKLAVILTVGYALQLKSGLVMEELCVKNLEGFVLRSKAASMQLREGCACMVHVRKPLFAMRVFNSIGELEYIRLTYFDMSIKAI